MAHWLDIGGMLGRQGYVSIKAAAEHYASSSELGLAFDDLERQWQEAVDRYEPRSEGPMTRRSRPSMSALGVRPHDARAPPRVLDIVGDVLKQAGLCHGVPPYLPAAGPCLLQGFNGEGLKLLVHAF
jgi:hypothetical protein